MKITKSDFRGVPAITYDTGKIALTFLPENGGRLASIKDSDGVEWMSFDGKGDKYLPIDLDSDYVPNDVFGMDDMFPTIDPEDAPVGSGCREGVLYNDHGEVARLPFDTLTVEDEKITMSLVSKRLFYKFTKTVTDENGAVKISYKIDNLSNDDFTFLWAGHCMLASEKDAELILPYGDGEAGEICFDELDEIGQRGTRFKVEKKHLIAKEFHPVDGNAYKFYYLNKMPKGEISLKRKCGTLTLSYDEKKIPYLGVWINNGRFKGFPCVAPEPCTVAFDKPSAAAERGQYSVIPANGSFEFDLTFDIN